MFLDTSGLMCLFDLRDERHITAVAHYQAATRRVTHNYVLAELVALAIARRAPMSAVLQFVKAIGQNQEVLVTWVDHSLHDRALQLLTARNDKIWSLCDAVSFVVMSDQSIRDALTTDHDFEQAGFRQLLDR
jgi:predicted nucleic acid-binding protein